MAVYVLVPLGFNMLQLSEAVQRVIHDDERFQMPSATGWLVAFKGTSIELSNALQITGQADGEKSPIGSCLVAPITSYYGRAPTDMWEWIKVKTEAGS